MRTRTFLILLGLILCSGIQAQQNEIPDGGRKAPADMLSARQIADGWIQLFDGTTEYGWRPLGEAKWSVADGALVSEPRHAGSLCTTTEFSSGELHFECSQGSTGHARIALCASEAMALTPDSAVLFDLATESRKTSSRPSAGPEKAVWMSYDLTAKGDTVELRIDRKFRGASRIPSRVRGYVGLMTAGKGVVQFRNIRFRPTGLKTVFNGKDLTGWIAPEGNKSVFSVTKEGWLNLKGGRGDLQTIEQWGDFVLQIDVYTNGDHLNSGVFFRAEQGKFEQGYEDQIRNQWEGGDRTKPVDYGTGAVYNRMPVRKVVSSDREWFTMTLIAHGTHIGSWVNGVLVCDFTDMRPPDQVNARKGARTRAGVISLQGHEPDTDLNFRSIRIAELPAAGK